MGRQSQAFWLLALFLACARGQQLIACLQKLDADVVTPNDVDDYVGAASIVNLAITSSPIAVVYVRSVEAVQGAVNCSRQAGFPAVARSGGHSYEGYSVQNNSVVVDLSMYLANYTSLGNGLAEVGAGIRLGPLYAAAWADGQQAFPGGTCPAVGMAQLLGGGWGLLARTYGLGCDRLVNLTMVNAQGAIVHASAQQNEDLFWASCGGGGGNFGIVTSMTLRLAKPPSNVTFAWIAWPFSQLQAVFGFWQTWAPKTDKRITSELFMASDVAEMHILCVDTMATCNQLLVSAGVFNISGFTTRYYAESSWLFAAIQIAKMTEGIGPSGSNDSAILTQPTWTAGKAFKAKSYNLQYPANQTAISTISAALAANQAGWVQLSAFGGAVNSVLWRSTAYAQRGMAFGIQYYISWTADDAAAGASSLAWINGLQQKLDQLFARHSYVNYIDADVSGGPEAYYTGAYPRLQQVKAAYDPTNYFNYPQSIALPQ